MNVYVWMFTSELFLIVTTIAHVHGASSNNSESCGVLFDTGVEAYLESRFQDCISSFEGALEKYRSYKKQLQHCRLKCSTDTAASDHLYPLDIENLHFYEHAIKNTFCILHCKFRNKELFGRYNLDFETEQKFEEGKPYEYLHLCYFQVNQKQKAASAAFTYLVAHPGDASVTKSLKYYATLPEVKMTDVINYEAKEFIYLYVHGVNSYERKEWKAVRGYMEESLMSYLQSEEECRADCEGPFNQGWFPDFIPSIANHFTYTLRCKRRCQYKLSSLNGDRREHLLPNHYHYLQFAYYQLGNIKASVQAAVSYLLFFPNDEVMLSNLEFYGKLPDIKEEYFKPRPEAVVYMQRDNYEQKLLSYIDAFSLEKESVILEKESAENEIVSTEGPSSLEQDNAI